jgi:DNA-binding NarL/FixJ family response regulator
MYCPNATLCEMDHSPGIWIVEDSALSAETLREAVSASFPTARIAVIGTESEFRQHLSRVSDHSVDIVVLDVMLRWARARPDAPPPPPEYGPRSRFRAGFRCAELLADNRWTVDVPVIVWTVLGREDIRPDLATMGNPIAFVLKSSSFEQLLRTMRSMLDASATSSSDDEDGRPLEE